MADYALGMNAKIYQGAATTTPPTDTTGLTEMSNVKNVTLSLEASQADVTTRGNGGWRATAATLRECTCEFEMLWKPGDAGFNAIKQAYLASGTIALAVLTGAFNVTDNEGPVGNWSITNFSRNEELEEAITVNVTAKLAAFGAWFEAA